MNETKNIKTITIREDIHRTAKSHCIRTNQKIGGYIERLIIQDCPHDNTFYQEKEIETNIPASLTCEDCGEELDIPEE